MKLAWLLIVSHLGAAVVGFATGIYYLPILAAPDAPTAEELRAVAAAADFTGRFTRARVDSDALHWGEGTVYLGPERVALDGEIAPGPQYKLYLSPSFVETEQDFLSAKPGMALLGDVDTFRGFIVDVPTQIDPSQFTTVIVWCEAFDQFITSAQYR